MKILHYILINSFIALLSLLAACGSSSQAIITPQATLSMAPPEPSAASTSRPALATATPAVSATAVSRVRPAVLDVVPLEVGSSWVYSVSVDYFDNSHGPGSAAEKHWTGVLTETITEAARQGDAMVYTVRLTGERFHNEGYPSELVRNENASTYYYAAWNFYLFRLNSLDELSALVASAGKQYDFAQWVRTLLVLPLEVGHRWGSPEYVADSNGWYAWNVSSKESLQFPPGVSHDCYVVQFFTLPDAMINWICPGIGTVRWDYNHHGDVDHELWELQEYRPFSPARSGTS